MAEQTNETELDNTNASYEAGDQSDQDTNDSNANEEDDYSSESQESEDRTFTQAEVNEMIARKQGQWIRKGKRQAQQDFQSQFGNGVNQPYAHQTGYYGDQQQGVEHQQQNGNFSITPDVIAQMVDVGIEQRARQSQIKDFEAKALEEANKDPDFGDFYADIKENCSPAMVEAAVDSKNPRVLYDLYKNKPSEFARIKNLPPVKQALAIARYEGRLSANSPKVVSTAPSTLKTPKGQKSEATRPYSEMSFAERRAIRRQRQRSR